MTKKTQKQILFERMNSVAGMPLNENYPWGAEHDPAAPWNEPEFPPDEDEGPDPDERHDRDYGDMKEDLDQPVDEFIPQGSYTVSNAGGYEIMIDDDGDAAMVRDAFGSDNPQTSDWLPIEYVGDEAVIDPNGYNIPLSQVMRLQEEDDKWIQKAVDPAHKGYCTPMTKDTCTPRRKALAKRFKAGIEDESVNETDAFLESVRETIQKFEESPKFGGEDVSQAMYDELAWDKQNMENAMADAFKTPEGYVMKNQVEVGEEIPTRDGDTVKVLGFDNDGNIRVHIIHGDANVEHFKKMGVPLKDFNISWTPVQFDAIVG